ncbi:S41 family peptidase [Portibacter marinus]|uniref:S41 family peptidase n=1 Tax=Portibacter marinus TaxID=2898660 RepID=UPI001F39195B|nr:S41 family peptidase [Portibacter marinus]
MKLKILILSLGLSFALMGQDDQSWFRYPSVSPDGSAIVFTHKGDLYRVSSKGGTATRLTFHEAQDYMPVWSNDGSKLAFASNRYGNFDVYVMEANGGEAHRITYHSNDEVPYTYTPDDKNIMFGGIRQDLASHRQFPHGSQSELYSVPVEGGRVDQVFTFPAEDLEINSNGTMYYYHDKKGGENPWRKHHVSAITRDIWSYDVASGTHSKITDFIGEDRQPILSQDEKSLYYLSEKSGVFNVHRLNLDDPAQSEQLTNFELHPARFLSRGDGLLAFGHHGEIYTMKDGESPAKVNIDIKTQGSINIDKYISINGDVQEMAISPNGKEIAFISRGEVFVTSVEESFTKRLTNTPEAERFITWGPEGKSVLYSSERDGKWSIYQTTKAREEEPFFFASTLLEETVVISNDQDNYMPRYSPDGKKLAYIEGRRTLKVKDDSTGTEVTLLTPEDLFHMRDGDKYFRWSPDSKWLLVDWDKTLSNSDILLLAADGSKRENLTKSGYRDYSPIWVNGGKQMLWFSNRNGLKSYATSGRTESDVYAMFFTQDAWDKHNLSEEEYKLQKAIKEEKEKEKKKKEEAEKKEIDKDTDKDEKKEEKKDSTLTFEWDEMEDWTDRLTIHSSLLSDAVLSKDGETLYYLSRFEGKTNLWSTNLRTKETKMALKLDANGGSLTWDKEMKNLFLLSGGKISKIDPEKSKKDAVKINGEMEYDADAEREAMFDHIWLRTNAIFYHPDFHGIDWDQMRKEYEPFLSSIGNSFEFTEMVSEMIGELNVSHAGARYRGMNVENEDETASLGIFMDYDHQGDGIRIEEVIEGGPLDKSDIDVEPGMVIEKIDGVTISPDRDVAEYLNRKAGKFTLLEVVNPNDQKRELITVKPISLSEERRLLYSRWVKINEEEVKEKSNGRLGYVHIPGMSDEPYRSMYEDMMGKYFEKEGVIIDTRFNGGGDLVADLAMFFTGVPFITYATEAKVVGGEPTSRWTKPTLALINEAQYSDGHCFAEGYSDLNIGKTVGMPTPGTCSFAGWERLPDGSVWGVVPISAKDIDGTWMENLQTEPDVLVKNMPGVIDQGRDQQLEKAIEVMLQDLNE